MPLYEVEPGAVSSPSTKLYSLSASSSYHCWSKSFWVSSSWCISNLLDIRSRHNIIAVAWTATPFYTLQSLFSLPRDRSAKLSYLTSYLDWIYFLLRTLDFWTPLSTRWGLRYSTRSTDPLLSFPMKLLEHFLLYLEFFYPDRLSIKKALSHLTLN